MKKIIIIISLLTLIGCFPDYQRVENNEAQMNMEVERKKIMDELKKKIEQVQEEYIYTSTNKADPFQTVFMKQSTIDGGTKIEATADITGPTKMFDSKKITDLQRFEIDELKITAIIYGTSTRRGIVVDPTGKSHIIKEGDFVGKNFGRITAIKNDKVLINEETYDVHKRKINKNIVMNLNPEDNNNE